MPDYDALLLVSFGGPDGPDDVMPFLENVTRGKNVPRQRLEQVAEHYALFDGISPINEQNRALLTALITALNAEGPSLPVYWGNRFWHPLLADVVQQMADDGVQRALALATSAFGSYPGCRAYREDIETARRQVGPSAPPIDKLRLFYDHPGFIAAAADRLMAAMKQLSPGCRVLFTAHSLPMAMAGNSPYERQLRAACALTAERAGAAQWELVYQSRSGRPSDAWLEPDVCTRLRQLPGEAVSEVVLAPIGFLVDHMEVVYDLDIEAAGVGEELGLRMARAETVGSHPQFIAAIRQLVLERVDPAAPRLALGKEGPSPDACADDCCRWPPG
jgi:ferrochelatase